MNQPSEQDNSVRAIRRLTNAVWLLVIAVLLHAAVSLFGGLISAMFDVRHVDFPSGMLPDGDGPYVDKFADFHAWPIEKQVKAASVIAVTRYEKKGDVTQSIIAEILKQAPGVKFYYKVGDVYEYTARNPFGDGMVVFFTGSPASMKYATSYEGTEFGMGIPLSVLKEMIDKQQ